MGIGELLHGGPPDADDITRIRATLLFEEPDLQRRLVRFTCLLVLASAIATFGLLADSVATVIGAMIVAPLMLPIMGLAFGISIGDRRAILSSLLVGLAGVVVAIGVGYVLSLPFTGFLDPEANSQIMARTAPRLVDLFAALATGLAGAFATSRSDVSDTLPGVAIAISLVPPLANVGILLGAHRVDLAAGSMLLFVTNYLAIALTGALLFAFMGFPRLAFAGQSKTARRTGVAVVFVLVLAITMPLAATSFSTVGQTLIERRVASAAEQWLKGTQYRFVSVSADGEDVRLVIAGRGIAPDVAGFKKLVTGQVAGRPVTVESVPEDVVTVQTK